MTKKIKSALISVFYKDGLEPIVKKLHQLGVTIFSTGGTQQFIESLGLPCIPVETITTYPSILGGGSRPYIHPFLAASWAEEITPPMWKRWPDIIFPRSIW